MRRRELRILFIHNHPTSFALLDVESLQKRYRVTECYLRSRRINPVDIWRQVVAHDLVFGWFASWHTFLPLCFARLARKPSLLIIGGYDLANLPQIGYGHQRGGLKKWVSRITMRFATCLVTNAYYSQVEADRNARIPKEKVHVVYHGLPDPFGAMPQDARAPLALTVGNVERANLWRKGHEPFVRAARFLPEVEFALVGNWRDDAIEHLRGIATPNVTFTGRVDGATLLDYYRQASVYVQVSAHEGFGMSVAEAMLAGCVPVVTRTGALPEVVGDLGVYTRSQEPVDIARAIQAALNLPEHARRQARQHILDYFPLERRQKSLERLIDSLVSYQHA
jgi:glycosyltransferase involved in cell wall biosynthesis